MGYEGGVDFLLYLFVQGAVGDEFPDGFIPEPEESGVFMVEAPAVLRVVGEAQIGVSPVRPDFAVASSDSAETLSWAYLLTDW